MVHYVDAQVKINNLEDYYTSDFKFDAGKDFPFAITLDTGVS